MKAQGDVLRYERELVLKQVALPPADYADLLKLNGAITTDENSEAVLKKAASGAAAGAAPASR